MSPFAQFSYLYDQVNSVSPRPPITEDHHNLLNGPVEHFKLEDLRETMRGKIF